ncbi:MAG: beta-hexosaminidase, partial [Paracoccaceae bacterium]|nr:beta-hexosaminidase [Paracoccaceae bacterium]
ATIAAGVDIALHCNGDLDEMAHLAQAAGPLSPQGQRRATRALAARRPPIAVDIAAAEAELSALLNGQGHV